jgi:hypothetical protein
MYQVHVNINRRNTILCMTISFNAARTLNVDASVKDIMATLGYEPGDYEYELQIVPEDLN